MKRLLIRIFFYTHFCIAIYCMACGLLDGYGLFHDWMIPNVVVFYGLVSAAIILPLASGISFIGAEIAHPFFVILGHVAMSFIQLFLGLMPLIT